MFDSARGAEILKYKVVLIVCTCFLAILAALPSGMASESDEVPVPTTVESSKTLGTFGKEWLPPEQADSRGVLLCLHGFGLNSSSFTDFGERMAAQGYRTYALDVRGFGGWRVSGVQPTCDFDASVQDVRVALQALRSAYPGSPVYLLGESMGGALALKVASEFPDLMDGVIASVPSSERFDQKKNSLRVGLRLLRAPNEEYDVSQKVVDKAVSKKSLRIAWISDPRNRLSMSPRELLQFDRFMNCAVKSSKHIKIPALLIQGCRDKLVRPESTVEIYNDISSKDKKLLLVGESEHLIFQKGLYSEQTLQMVLAWMNSHTPAE